MKLTEEQKAERRARAAERKAAQAMRWEQAQKDRSLIGMAMRAILADDKSTTREKVFAALTLDEISTSTLVPREAARLYELDISKMTADFEKRLEKYRAAENK